MRSQCFPSLLPNYTLKIQAKVEKRRKKWEMSTDYSQKRENVGSEDSLQLCTLTVTELKYTLFCTVHSLKGIGLLLEEYCLCIYMMWYIMGKTNTRHDYCSSNTRTPAFGITRYFSEALTAEGETGKGKGTNQIYKSKGLVQQLQQLLQISLLVSRIWMSWIKWPEKHW